MRDDPLSSISIQWAADSSPTHTEIANWFSNLFNTIEVDKKLISQQKAVGAKGTIDPAHPYLLGIRILCHLSHKRC